MNINVLIALLALVLAIIAVVIQRLDLSRTYVRLSLSIDRPAEDLLLARTRIDNRVTHVKEITAVFLLLGPEEDEPMSTVNRLLTQVLPYPGRPVCCPIDLRDHVPLNAMRDRSGIRQVIPLPYYTIENINVADEMLAYTQSIDVSEVIPGCYSLRLYVYGEKRLYRLVQDAFVIQRHSVPSTPIAVQTAIPPAPPCRALRHCPKVGRMSLPS